MKHIFLCFLIGLQFQFAEARRFGPIIVGNAGESEYSLMFVRSNLSNFFADCLTFACSLSQDERQLMSRISSTAPSAPVAKFLTSAEMPKVVFELHPEFNEVWFNRDLLWLDANQTEPYNIPDAFALWIQILAAPLNLPAETTKKLGDEAKRAFRDHIVRGGIGTGDAKQTFEFLLWKRQTSYLITRDPSLQSLDLTPLIHVALECPGATTELNMYSPAWLPTGRSAPYEINLTLQFGVTWKCDGKFQTTNGFAFLTAGRVSLSQPWSYQPQKIEVFIDKGNK